MFSWVRRVGGRPNVEFPCASVTSGQQLHRRDEYRQHEDDPQGPLAGLHHGEDHRRHSGEYRAEAVERGASSPPV
ncbi:Uncharacterised protein [Mycobacteroides abscessus subsp. abscessus]|nr:Uncharacterised protein [Mycobacteroides abscessus subsp. abscessus]